MDRLAAAASTLLGADVAQATTESLCYTAFAPLVLDPNRPHELIWPEVRDQLEDVFGSAANLKQEEVLGGWLGLPLVVKTLQMLQETGMSRKDVLMRDRWALTLTEAAWEKEETSAEISSKQVTEELPDEKPEYEGPPTPDTATGARHDLKAEASPEPEFELVVQPTPEFEVQNEPKKPAGEAPSDPDPDTPTPNAEGEISSVVANAVVEAAPFLAPPEGTVDPKLVSPARPSPDIGPAKKKRSPSTNLESPEAKKPAVTAAVAEPPAPRQSRPKRTTASLNPIYTYQTVTPPASTSSSAASPKSNGFPVASTKLTGIYARLRVVDSLIRKIAIALCSLPSMKGSADEITSVVKAKFPSESKAGLKERILQTLGAHASFSLIEPGLTEWELLEPWREHALVGLESLKNDPEARLWCLCQRPSSLSDMIQCHQYHKCKGAGWYHTACIGAEGKKAFRDKTASWCCDTCTRSGKS